MIHTRRLTAERSTIVHTGIFAEEDRRTVSSQVFLAEWQSPTASVPSRYIIAFAHHVMFDFAVSQLFLPIQSERVVGKLAADPDLIMIIRPSIVMRYEQLWREDRPKKFWICCFSNQRGAAYTADWQANRVIGIGGRPLHTHRLRAYDAEPPIRKW